MVRRVYAACLIAYGGLVAWVTLRSLPGPDGSPDVIPFLDTWRQIRDYGDRATLWEVGGNFVLFLPLGFLLAAWSRRSAWVIGGIAAVTSVVIEVNQWALVGGRNPSVDDVMYNTAGAATGAVVFTLLLGAATFWRGPRSGAAETGERVSG